MAAITFDTLFYAKRLQEAGFTERQAEVQAETLKSVVDNTIATKYDIEGIHTKLDKLESKFDKLEEKVNKMELTLTLRLGGMLVAVMGILIAVLKF